MAEGVSENYRELFEPAHDTAADGRQAVDRALAHQPDVAVVDLQMPVVDGVVPP